MKTHVEYTSDEEMDRVMSSWWFPDGHARKIHYVSDMNKTLSEGMSIDDMECIPGMDEEKIEKEEEWIDL